LRTWYRPLSYVIFAFLVIGILVRFADNPGGMLIPLVIFGVVFYLYKFPPRRFFRGKPSILSSRSSKKRSGKNSPFRVIQGNKKDEDEPPRRVES
jgi:hypothetical protein